MNQAIGHNVDLTVQVNTENQFQLRLIKQDSRVLNKVDKKRKAAFTLSNSTLNKK